jgi:dihydroxyacid dehydratase/phosphogluconate dehydratase
MTSSNNPPAGIRLRSAQWYAGDDRNAYIHRAWMRRGVPDDAFTGRPHIAIANTASDLTPCNAHLTEVAASVKNGVYEAGGIPLELPVVSLGETLLRPTAMLWRNMAAMATEEMLRANPIDGVVLLGGCDKTIPSLLVAAASVDVNIGPPATTTAGKCGKPLFAVAPNNAIPRRGYAARTAVGAQAGKVGNERAVSIGARIRSPSGGHGVAILVRPGSNFPVSPTG